MPELANARHELFAALVAFGKASGPEAYRQAGYRAAGHTAENCASRLMRNEVISARIGELKASKVAELGVTTTDIVRRLNAVAVADLIDIMDYTFDKKGHLKSLTYKNLRDIPPLLRQAIKSFEIDGHGKPKIVFENRTAANRLLGMHLGMFQGESAGAVPTGSINNIQNNTVFVDAPRRESVAEWQARVDRERAPKVIDQGR